MIILQYPNDHLRIKTKSIEKVTDDLVKTAEEMYKVMIAANGIGLAATQVGLDISLIVLEDNGAMMALFNPLVLKKSTDQRYDMEGCLSFTGVFRRIKRSTEVTVKYRDINNKMQFKKFENLQARALLHEYDHLQGKLFIDLEEKAIKEE